MKAWEDRESRAAQSAWRSRLLHIIPAIHRGLHWSAVTPHPGVILGITISFNISIILKSVLSSTKASSFQPPLASDCFWNWNWSNLILFATLNSLWVSVSLRWRGEMIAPANIMGITEDWTGMKLSWRTGGLCEQGWREFWSGEVCSALLCADTFSVIYDFVAGKGAALIARKCIHISLFT